VVLSLQYVAWLGQAESRLPQGLGVARQEDLRACLSAGVANGACHDDLRSADQQQMKHYTKCPQNDWQARGLFAPPDCQCPEIFVQRLDEIHDRTVDEEMVR
jgi:hypothetical protein